MQFMPHVEENKSLLMTNFTHWRKCTLMGTHQANLGVTGLLGNCQSGCKATPFPNLKQYNKRFYSNKMVSEKRKHSFVCLCLLIVKSNTTQYSNPYSHLLYCLLFKLVHSDVGGSSSWLSGHFFKCCNRVSL